MTTKDQGPRAKDEPRAVSRFEAKLLRILRAVLRQSPVESALPLVLERSARPACLSRAAVELVGDHLAKGCVLYLARAGGWRRERFLRGGQARDGRLWERTPPGELGLSFSGHSLEFLIWLTAARPNDAQPPWQPPEAELTAADRLLLFLAYDALRDTEAGPALRARPAFNRHGLCRLAYPEDFAQQAANAPPPDFAPWVNGPGAWMLEALQPVLKACWLHAERRKAQVGDWQALRALGLSQERVLGAFTAAADAAGRPDLVRFLLQTAAELLMPNVTPAFFVGGLQGGGPPRLADRFEVYRRAVALLRHLDALQRWERRARTIGFLDEGYAAAQLWKSDWERLGGEELAARAQAVVRQIEPLRVQA
jgi:hypothetical protein